MIRNFTQESLVGEEEERRLREKHRVLVEESKRVFDFKDKAFDFETQLTSSEDNSNNPIWINTYKEMFKDFLTEKYMFGDSTYQRKGIDRIVYLKRGKEILIDEKEDTLDNNRMFLEIWSDKERGKEGWLIDTSKTCDYIAYLKIPKNKVYLFPFLDLQRMWDMFGGELVREYGLKEVKNKDDKTGRTWITEGVAVPIKEVYQLISNSWY